MAAGEAHLARWTTLGLGGPAARFVEAYDSATLCDVVRRADQRGEPVFVLGGGSNVVVADAGFDGVAVRVATRGIVWTDAAEALYAEVAAGVGWDDFVAEAVARAAQGVECLAGIPGTVGATPIQNVGAYGQEVSDTICAVTAFDRRAQRVVTLDASACDFGYRDSRFKRVDRDRFVVLSVRFALRRGAAPAVRYAELARALADGPAPTLSRVRDTVLALRRAKGMVYDPAQPEHRSAGSFFTNPVVEAATAEAVAARAGADAAMPRFDAPGGRVKLAAGWLIERAGIARGMRQGGSGVSSRHALALVNHGGTAAELVALAQTVQARVWERFAVHLVPEPVFVGFGVDDPTGVMCRR